MKGSEMNENLGKVAKQFSQTEGSIVNTESVRGSLWSRLECNGPSELENHAKYAHRVEDLVRTPLLLI
jgi:hypothetical protein